MKERTNPNPPTASTGVEAFIARTVITVMALIAMLTFAFSFGNVWHLASRLGVPPWIAPLVGPAVDLSVVGLLLGIQYVALSSPSRTGLRPARALLVFSGLATLGLNIADPIASGQYGKAALDAVAPLLLIGWSEVGPGLLRQVCAHRSDSANHRPLRPRAAPPSQAVRLRAEFDSAGPSPARGSRAPPTARTADLQREPPSRTRHRHRRGSATDRGTARRSGLISARFRTRRVTE